MKYPIHISDVRSFLSCRRRWNWASPLRRNLEPDVPYMPFFSGRAVHYCLEMLYSKDTPLLQSLDLFLQQERKLMGKLWPKEEQAVQEQIDLIVEMLRHYEIWISTMTPGVSKWSDDNLEFLALETEFAVPLYSKKGRKSSKVFLEGRMDGVVKLRSDGSVWIWETKTTRSIDELKRSLPNDMQAGAYIYAAQQLFDVQPSGVLYNMLRKKAPTIPEVLKDGTLTKRSNIDTTAEAYLQAIRQQHPEWRGELIRQEYGGILQTLLDKGNTFFARYPVLRTRNEIEELVGHLHTIALEMTDPGISLYPNPSWTNCNFCPFRAPCLTWNAGGDYEFLLQHEYALRKRAVSFREEEESINAG